MIKRQMSVDQVTRIINNEIEKKGYRLETHDSVSTNSRYFKLYSDDTSFVFRISDHPCAPDRKVKTLRVDHKTNVDKIQGFVRNCCEDLSHKRTRILLGLR